MACCLMAPSHYLNQCWQTISDTLCHPPESNFTVKAEDICPWYEFENNWVLLLYLPGAIDLIRYAAMTPPPAYVPLSLFMLGSVTDELTESYRRGHQDEVCTSLPAWHHIKLVWAYEARRMGLLLNVPTSQQPSLGKPHRKRIDCFRVLKDAFSVPTAIIGEAPIEGAPFKTLKQSMTVSGSWRVCLLLSVPTAIIGVAP